MCNLHILCVQRKKEKDACNGKEKRDTHAPHLVRRSQPSSSSQSPGCSVENASVYLASATPIPRSVFPGSFPSCRSLPPRSGSCGLPPRPAPQSFGPPGNKNIWTSSKVIQTSSMASQTSNINLTQPQNSQCLIQTGNFSSPAVCK